ncbi:MAG: tetratricopeptide repeat protein [Planctomycetes bacterium]|nr:tetratricopeptide repeat protein [Planctomycetota bacterium]
MTEDLGPKQAGAPDPSATGEYGGSLDKGLRLAFGSSGSRWGELRAEQNSAAPSSFAEDAPERYAIEGELARGGMGIVYRGVDRALGREVALKVLIGERAPRPDVLERFVEEAQVAAQLHHPGIIPVYEFTRARSGAPVLVMEFVKGETLAAKLQDRGTATRERTELLRIFERVCEAMAYAHARGVVHRDLKPSNVLLGEHGTVLVVDWGLAKVLPRASEAPPAAAKSEPRDGSIHTLRTDGPGSASLAGSVLGTPAYMSPEQARGRVDLVDARADVFALGAMLCEILTGAPPYVGTTGEDLLLQARDGDTRAASARIARSGVAPELIALASAALSRDREQRPADAEALSEALRRQREAMEERRREAEVARVRAETQAEQDRRARRLVVGLVAVLALISSAALAVRERYRREVARRAEELRSAGRRALSEVASLRGEALARSGEDAWMRCAARARDAVSLLAAPEADAELHAEAQKELLSAEEQRLAAQALALRLQREQSLLLDLERIRSHFADHSSFASFERLLGEALGRAGFDANAEDTASLAGRIRGTSIALPLRELLECWALGVDRSVAPTLPEERERLLALLRELDPDAAREAIRSACASADPAALRALLAAPEALRADTHLLALVCDVAYHRAARELQQRAIALLEEAVAAAPGDFWLQATLAHALSFEGDAARPRSEAAFQAAVALRPSLVVAWSWWAVAGNMWRDLALQERALVRALEIDPTAAAARNNFAVLEIGRGRFAEAEVHLRLLVAQHPEHLKGWYNLGVVCARLSRPTEALEHYDRVLAQAPDMSDALVEKGVVLLALGRAAEAEPCLEKGARSMPRDPYGRIQLGKLRMRQGRLAEAIQTFDAALKLAPDHPELLLQKGIALHDLQRYRQARPLFERLVANDPQHVQGWHNLGMACAELGDVAKAELAYRRTLELDPRVPWSAHNLGRLLQVRGDRSGAEELFRREIAQHPDRWESWLELGNLGTSSQRHDVAVVWIERGLAVHPRQKSLLENHASALRMLGSVEEAIERLEALLQQGIDDPILRLNLAYAYRTAGAEEASFQHLSALLEREPKRPEAVMGVAIELFERARFEETAELLRNAARDKVPNAEAARLGLERHAALFRALEAGERVESSDLAEIDHIGLARMLIVRGHARAALDWLQPLLEGPANRRPGSARLTAACAALRLAEEAVENDAESAAASRAKAFSWLSEDLEALRCWREDDSLATLGQVRGALVRWRKERLLAGVRDAPAATLAEDAETAAAAWHALFRDARELEQELRKEVEERLAVAREETR